MEKQSLKLKLKIGGPATPDSDGYPKDQIEDMAEEDQTMPSDDDAEEDEWPDDGQAENGAEDDSVLARNRHTHHDDSTREKHKKSKKKKKKREREREKEKERHKHRHHRDKIEGEEESTEPLKKYIKTEEGVTEPVMGKEDYQNSLNEVLIYLQDQLEKKDAQNFFAHPVTDLIAPGYSSIITQPMDFTKIKEKILNNEYSSIPQFTNDVKLMCNNCMTYNQQDTIYFKSAKRLFHVSEKMLSKDRIISMRKEMPSIMILHRDQVGFEMPPEGSIIAIDNNDTLSGDEASISMKDELIVESVSKFEAIPDDLTPEEILEQVTTSAQEAAEKLTQKKPESTLGFLRQRVDGTTSLNFLMGCEGGDPNVKEKPVSLGLITGKLTQGTAALHNYRDDRRTMAKPVKPLNYGSYSSFCPSYDSTFANLTKEESERVYATYGDDTAVQYAESIMDFSRNCNMATYLVDQLLNLLTHKQHSVTQAAVEERKKTDREEEKIASNQQQSNGTDCNKCDTAGEAVNFSSLKSLSQLGIDTSFLEYYESMEQKNKTVKMQLDENAQLLDDLAKTQRERLSKSLPTNLNQLSKPSPAEIHLVEKVTEGLASVARQVPPGSLAPVPIVRRALGITMVPVSSESNEQLEV